MKLVVSLLTILTMALVVAMPAVAEEGQETKRSAEAIQILEKVDAAIKQVHAVRYEASTKPSGAAENFVQAAEGSTLMVGFNGSIPEKFRVHVKTQRQESGEPVEVTGGGDGETFFLIDHGSKKAYQDMDPNVMGSNGRALQSLSMIEYVHDHPYDDELNADEVELQGTETVGGEDCHKIHVVYSGGGQRSTWFFSKNDYLPRRRVQHFSGPQGEGTIERTITKLEVNPEVDPGLFKLKLPEGYEQIDDFAP